MRQNHSAHDQFSRTYWAYSCAMFYRKRGCRAREMLSLKMSSKIMLFIRAIKKTNSKLNGKCRWIIVQSVSYKAAGGSRFTLPIRERTVWTWYVYCYVAPFLVAINKKSNDLLWNLLIARHFDRLCSIFTSTNLLLISICGTDWLPELIFDWMKISLRVNSNTMNLTHLHRSDGSY